MNSVKLYQTTKILHIGVIIGIVSSLFLPYIERYGTYEDYYSGWTVLFMDHYALNMWLIFISIGLFLLATIFLFTYRKTLTLASDIGGLVFGHLGLAYLSYSASTSHSYLAGEYELFARLSLGAIMFSYLLLIQILSVILILLIKKKDFEEIPVRKKNAKEQKKYLKEEKKLMQTSEDFDYKNRLYGMIRVRKEIDIDKAAEFLHVSPKIIETYIYDLAGKEAIQGSFHGKVFRIESDVDNFISALDTSFHQWEESKVKKH